MIRGSASHVSISIAETGLSVFRYSEGFFSAKEDRFGERDFGPVQQVGAEPRNGEGPGCPRCCDGSLSDDRAICDEAGAELMRELESNIDKGDLRE